MIWFRCQCGHITTLDPRHGEIVSAYHLHPAGLDDTSRIVRMEEVPDLVLEPVLEPAGGRTRR